jgi:hypothetical protein
MSLIDRYLRSVHDCLPASTVDDIIRELSEDIHAQAADREAELGRPLTDTDLEALLKQYGHPMLLAARYRPQRQLISPVVFPFYWLAIKIALGSAVAVRLAIAVAMLVGGSPADRVIGPLAAFPFTGAVTIFGWVTLAFVVLDLCMPHITGASVWSPRSLPELIPEAPRRRLGLVAEIIASTVFLWWWLAIPYYPFLVFGPAASFIEMAPAWRALHLPIAGLWLAGLAVLWIILFRPAWTRLRVAWRVGANLVGLVIAFVLLRADAIVTLVPVADASAPAAGVVHAINLGFRIGVVVWICAALWEIVRDLWHWRAPRTA